MVASSTCCGLLSLRTAMLISTLIDITFGISDGALIYLIIKTKQMAVSLSIKSGLEFIRAIIALICLFIILIDRES